MRLLIEDAIKNKNKINILLLDLEKAYDSIDLEFLLEIMNKMKYQKKH
jgi:hypothetical protein